MIIVIAIKERNPRTGRMEEIVSHGVDVDTDKTVILPCVSPQAIGAVFDSGIGEYVLQNA